MDFGNLIEYLGPLAFLLIAFINNFLKKKKPKINKPIKRVINDSKKEIKNFQNFIFDTNKKINNDSLTKKEAVVEKNILIPDKIIESQIIEKRDHLNLDSKKSKKLNDFNNSIKEKLRDKKSLKDAFVLKEILEKKF
tara:strand:- start:242 stop:652 length:411 start_codon:yes stop_codon:yes gene_type:complete